MLRRRLSPDFNVVSEDQAHSQTYDWSWRRPLEVNHFEDIAIVRFGWVALANTPPNTPPTHLTADFGSRWPPDEIACAITWTAYGVFR
jgi:hypothetical protein